VAGCRFSPGTLVSSTNKIDITKILLKVVLNTITPPLIYNKYKKKKTHSNSLSDANDIAKRILLNLIAKPILHRMLLYF
jgi:hypothetical protein